MIIIAGLVRVPLAVREKLQPHLETFVAATRAEAGCRGFSFGFDAVEPEVMRVFEIFDDDDAFAVHRNSAHMAAWREARESLGVIGRELSCYVVTESHPI